MLKRKIPVTDQKAMTHEDELIHLIRWIYCSFSTFAALALGAEKDLKYNKRWKFLTSKSGKKKSSSLLTDSVRTGFKSKCGIALASLI